MEPSPDQPHPERQLADPPLSSTLGARPILPHDIASFAVGGDLDTVRNRYTLRGTAGGSLQFGPNLPFSFEAIPTLREDQFKLTWALALGPQADAARFNTDLEIRKIRNTRKEKRGNELEFIPARRRA